MATSCRESFVRIEEEVIQPVSRYERQVRERCKNEDCNWLLLCLNKLVCNLYWVVVKITEMVVVVVVRWGTRLVCVIFSLVVGILAMFIGNFDIIGQALLDTWELLKNAFFLLLGLVVFAFVHAIDFIQTVFKIEKKRSLTKEEEAILRMVFDDSLAYGLINIIEERPGILRSIDGQPRAFTIGYNIYLPLYSIETLVHECVHVWQFQFAGTQYIGESMLNQAGSGAAAYNWEENIGTGSNAWYLMESTEAQAKFIDTVFTEGRFILNDGTFSQGNGVFFHENDNGTNRFEKNGVNYTDIANHAWNIIRT